jgi:hypothetical protein
MVNKEPYHHQLQLSCKQKNSTLTTSTLLYHYVIHHHASKGQRTGINSVTET